MRHRPTRQCHSGSPQHREDADDRRDVEHVLESPQSHIAGSQSLGVPLEDREQEERGRERGRRSDQEEQRSRDDLPLVGGDGGEAVLLS